MARVNLGIALYYLPDAEGAKREAEKALVQNSNQPHSHYILGLIARSLNRTDEAVAEFQKVLKIDPRDSATNILIGQLYVQQKKYPEATAAFRKAIDAEPYNETALYNLGLLLNRTGAKDEGQRLIEKFQELRASGAGTTIGTNYLEGGRYAEAIVSTGLEPELVDLKTPEVAFTDVTQKAFRPPMGPARGSSTVKQNPVGTESSADAVVLFDYDGDGDLDLFDASGSQKLFRNDGGHFTETTHQSGLTTRASKHGFAAVAGDYDNDGKPDILVVRSHANSVELYRNEGGGHFSKKPESAGISIPPTGPSYASAAFLDADHDGDLDVVIAGPRNILFRNNGDGSFKDITATANVGAKNDSAAAQAVVPTDFDNRRDIDLLVLNGAAPTVFRNMRDGTFRDVTKEIGLTADATDDRLFCAAAGDINKDGFPDFFLGGATRGKFALSDRPGHFQLVTAPIETANARGAQFLDYDNDGLLDLVAITNGGLRIWRNVGGSFKDVSKSAVPPVLQNLTASHGADSRPTLASGDLDSDGDVDLIVRDSNGALRLLRNDGGNRNHSVTVNLHGRVSNASGIAAKVEMRAGSLWQRLETYAASPAPAPADLVFGLGKRESPDAVRVIWPAGVLQTEMEFPALARSGQSKHMPITISITELDRKPSSCPYLYTWNGERFEFVTDFMGGGEMGHLEEVGRYNKPDPDEYVRIRGDQLTEKNGSYELRVTNELEEAVFFDRLQLLIVTHPEDTEVYPNEGMSDPPRPFKVFTTRGARAPVRAVDEHGHDVLDLITRIDRRYPDDFALDRVRGYSSAHALTMQLAKEQPNTRPQTLLLLTGWTDYAWSSDTLAAMQAGKTLKAPELQVKDASGRWQTVIENIGIPVGRPQTVTVDLTGKFLSASREIRIVTSMRIYWDQILVDISSEDARTQVTRLEPVRSVLSWRGFSEQMTHDGREPFTFDYHRVSLSSPWKVMTGRYTREGDVRELLLESDDMFVILQAG